MIAQGLRQAADEARRAKEEFVANVSHELRTPLNMVIGFTQMIVDAPEAYSSHLPAALVADLNVILRNSQHLSNLIDDVLDLSQIEAGQMALTRENVAIREIVEAAMLAVRPLFDSKKLYLRAEIPADLPSLFCDRTRVREVLLNLLSNAGRFTERGGVTVRSWQQAQDLLVSVSDTGRGIAAADMTRLFQPFQQGDSSIRRRYGGTGLGLSISKRFIELHDGDIKVESVEGMGTTFTFRLPLTSPAPLAQSPGSGIRAWPPAGLGIPAAHCSFDCAEDGGASEAGRDGPQPHGPEAAQPLPPRRRDPRRDDMEEAVNAMARLSGQALLINDVSPETALRLLQQSPLPDALPALICSLPPMHRSADALGAADYLIKPVAREALLGALAALDLPGKTILVVDDEPDARRLFWRMLATAEQGYRVLVAMDGRQALQVMQEEHPDAVLLDLVMPQMDGFQVLAAKNAIPALRDIPVVVVSAQDPAGQPVVSNFLTIARSGGLSLRQLLECIGAAVNILSPLPDGLALGAASVSTGGQQTIQRR